MLVEIFLSLVGYTGDLITDDYKLQHLVKTDLLTSAQAQNIEELVVLGKQYKEIKGFVESQKDISNQEISLVLRALKSGLHETLHEYQKQIYALEQKALSSDPCLPITKLRYYLKDYYVIFPASLQLIGKVKKQKLKGGQIIKELYTIAYYNTADPAIRISFGNLLAYCHSTWIHILEGWLIHGVIIDPHKEFFIEELDYDVKVLSLENEDSHFRELDIWSEYEWFSKFKVRFEMVPIDFIDSNTVYKILFCGKAKRVLKGKDSIYDASRVSLSQSEDIISEELSKIKRNSSTGRIDSLEFHNSIERMYADIAHQLLRFVVEDSKLMEHLHFVRDFFLLGRGEFYRSFIEESAILMSSPPRPTLAHAEFAVNKGPWREASIQNGIDEWSNFKKEQFNKLKPCLNCPSIDFSTGFTRIDTNIQPLNPLSRVGTKSNPSNISKALVPPGIIGLSKVTDLVIVGETVHTETSHTIDFTDAPGAVWHRTKLPLDKGFETTIEFSIKKDCNSESFFSFAIHHDTSYGPTALGYFENQDITQSCRIPNSIIVAISFSSKMIYMMYRTHTMCLEILGSKSIADGAIHLTKKSKLRIIYDLKGETSPKMHLVANLNETTALEVQIDINKAIQLERGSGRGWVGFMGHANKDTALSLCTWTFHAFASRENNVSFDTWRSLLTLKYDVSWPLHLVLTREHLDCYGMLFQFLLSVKRVGDSLKESWAILNQSCFKASYTGYSVFMEILRLRASMEYLINNLQYHLQVDVIDVLQKNLTEQIKSATNFELVVSAHDKFMNELITRSFLHNKVIRNSLDTVLRRCLRFCKLVEKFSLDFYNCGDKAKPISEYNKLFQQLDKSFARDTTFLCALLTRMNSNLLLRIDFNGYFGRIAKGTFSS